MGIGVGVVGITQVEYTGGEGKSRVGRGEVRGQRSESRRLGAVGQAGLPGVAWVRQERWLLLGSRPGSRPGQALRGDDGDWARAAGRGWRLAMMSTPAMQSVHASLAVLAGMAWSRTGRRVGAEVVREADHAWGGGSAVGSGRAGEWGWGEKRSPCRRC